MNRIVRISLVIALYAWTTHIVFAVEPDKEIVNSVGMKMVRIESGSFVMGQVEGGDFDERPVHEVEISREFYMGATEVTNAQFEKFRPGHRKTSGKPDELSNADDEAVIVDGDVAVKEAAVEVLGIGHGGLLSVDFPLPRRVVASRL